MNNSYRKHNNDEVYNVPKVSHEARASIEHESISNNFEDNFNCK
jgi:hypothetical protein